MNAPTTIPGTTHGMAALTSAELIRTMAMGFMLPRCLHLAALLDIAGEIGDAALSAGELASRTGAHADALHRTLRALSSAGVFEEVTEGRFRNTAASNHLRADHPRTLRSWVMLYGSSRCWESWHNLEHSVRTGEPAFERIHGVEAFEYLARHPMDAALFDAAMVENSALVADAILEACDFSRFKVVADIGGGRGTMIRAILERHRNCRGILFDMPHVRSGAEDFLNRAGLSGRCEFIDGSFFEGVPAGADAYFLQRVLHDWDDDHCRQILSRCAEAMGPDARLIVSDAVILPGNDYHPAKLSDLHMMAMTHGGRERTAAEFSSIFASAGLALVRILATRSPLSLIEATKI